MIETHYIGEDLKYLLNATCQGYSMDDGFTIELICGNKRYTCKSEDIFHDEDENKWYLTVDTCKFCPGLLQMIFKAQVDDDAFPDGKRAELAIKDLCKLKDIPRAGV